MTEYVHEWELIFKLDSFRRVRCKHCPEQMLDYDIERRLNATERLSAEDARTMAFVSEHDELISSSGIRRLRAYADILEGK